jgi:hypothetical protein
VDNIKMDLVEIGWGGVDWIGLPQDRGKRRALVVSVSQHFMEPEGSIPNSQELSTCSYPEPD